MADVPPAIAEEADAGLSLWVNVVATMAVPSNFHLWNNEAVARAGVRQFVRSKDPRIGMLRRFAATADVPLDELINGPKVKRKK